MKELLKVAVVIACIYGCTSLLGLDGALAGAKNHILSRWTAADFILPLVVAFVVGKLQWILLKRPISKMRCLPLAVGFAGVVLSDLSWLCSNDYGGRIVAFLLLSAIGPICVGSVTSAIVFWFFGKGKPASNDK